MSQHDIKRQNVALLFCGAPVRPNILNTPQYLSKSSVIWTYTSIRAPMSIFVVVRWTSMTLD